MRRLAAASNRAGFFVCVHIDASAVQKLIAAHRERGVRLTHTHILVKASADLLAAKPEYHRVVAGNRRLRARRVDVGLSVAADQPLAPILVIEAADRKSLAEIGEEVGRRAPEARAEFSGMVSEWNLWGWLVPISFLRRSILRVAASGLNARRKAGGTFQITNLPDVDLFVPLLMGGVSALGVGRVSDRAVAHHGQVVVRPMVTLGFGVDHAVFGGREAVDFLSELKSNLEGCDPRTDLLGNE